MGMFDTIILSSPVECPVCGSFINYVQTKKLHRLLLNFRVGDIVTDDEKIAVLDEDLYCDKCHKMTGKIYIVIYHGIYIYSASTEKEADDIINKFDVLKLAKTLSKAKTKYYYEIEKIRTRLEDIIDYYSISLQDRAKRYLEPGRLSVTLMDLRFEELSKKDIMTDIKKLLNEINSLRAQDESIS